MGGGVGFAGQGRESYKQNSKLLGKRSRMKDNPYNFKTKRLEEENYEEIREFKKNRNSKHLITRSLIWMMITVTIIVAIIIAVFHEHLFAN